MKEEYLHISALEHEVSAMVAEIHASGFRQRKWEANLHQSALVVADMQNYFLDPSSHAFVPSATAILPAISRLINFFRDLGRPVVFTRHVNDLSNAGSMRWWWKDLIIEGTREAMITDRLNANPDEILTKFQYDAFHGTDLEGILTRNNVIFPVICGVMTNLCCETTVRSAFVRGFQPVLPIDATATYNHELHISTYKNLSFGFSPALTTDEVIKALKA